MVKAQEYRDVTRFLKSEGWILIRSGKGSHEIWGDPATGRRMSIPAHREVSAGIVRQIIAEFPSAPWTWR
ncbi:MAG: type II toxin-antitoxin system HicA family toxin [Ancrocorticia sp.]